MRKPSEERDDLSILVEDFDILFQNLTDRRSKILGMLQVSGKKISGKYNHETQAIKSISNSTFNQQETRVLFE